MKPFRRLHLVLAIALGGILALPGAALARPDLGIAPAGFAFANPAKFGQDMTRLHQGKSAKLIVRLDILWPTVAPTEPADPRNPADPAYNWGPLDAAVAGAIAGGATRLHATVYYTPPWASALASQPAGRRTNLPDVDAYADFLVAIQARYSTQGGATRFASFEVWNEPNIGMNLNAPGGTPKARRKALLTHYSKMVHASRAALRSSATALGIPKPLLIAGAVGGVSGIQHDLFFKELGATALCKGAAKSRSCFDAVSIHPYSQNPRVNGLGTNQRPSIVSVGNFGSFTKLIASIWRGRATPIWVSEIAWQTDPPDRYMGVSYRNQARYLKDTHRIFAGQHPQVKVMIWFQIEDDPENPDSPGGGWQSGLLTSTGKEKPSWNAFRGLLR